eukprot:7430975-Pyramimonas_sp.AAC.1
MTPRRPQRRGAMGDPRRPMARTAIAIGSGIARTPVKGSRLVIGPRSSEYGLESLNQVCRS